MTYPIPKAALDDKLGWTGITGSGKTYNTMTAVEALLTLNRRVIMVDPLDVWWGLRRSADGKSKAFDVVIFGGKHGDLPLNEHAGALVGETVATAAQSCIISLGDFATKSAERRFMLSFLETLYRKANGEPVHLIFDEADMWAPQKPLKEAAFLQAKMEQLVRRGRVKGFIPWLITQRPAVLSKDVLSQMDGLIMFKLTSPHDRDAIGDWVQGQADKDEWKRYWANMATMEKGQGLIWIPSRGILKVEQFPEKQTFDSSKTPKRGEKQKSIKLQAIDLGELKEKMTTVEEETKANDPKLLKQEIAKLKQELAGKPKTLEAGPEMQKLLQQSYDNGFNQGFDAGRDAFLERLCDEAERFGNIVGKAFLDKVRQEKHFVISSHTPPIKVLKTALVKRDKFIAEHLPKMVNASPPAHYRKPAVEQINGEALNSSQLRIVDALQFWLTIGYDGPSREQVAAVAGFKPNGGHFTNILGSMRSLGIIEYPIPGNVKLLKKDMGTPLTGTEARERLKSILNGSQLKVVQALQGQMTREALSDAAGFSAGGGHFTNVLGSLRTIDVVRYPFSGLVEFSQWAEELLV